MQLPLFDNRLLSLRDQVAIFLKIVMTILREPSRFAPNRSKINVRVVMCAFHLNVTENVIMNSLSMKGLRELLEEIS